MPFESIETLTSAKENGTAFGSQMNAALILLVACIAPGAAVMVVFWRLHFGGATLPPTTAWIDEFCIERYRPMLQLLNDTDLQSTARISSVAPSVVAHFRWERYRILRGYLRSLAADFTQVIAALKLVMTQ